MGMNVKSAKKRGMLPKTGGVNTYRGGMGNRKTRQTAAYKKATNCRPKNCGYM